MPLHALQVPQEYGLAEAELPYVTVCHELSVILHSVGNLSESRGSEDWAHDRQEVIVCLDKFEDDHAAIQFMRCTSHEVSHLRDNHILIFSEVEAYPEAFDCTLRNSRCDPLAMRRFMDCKEVDVVFGAYTEPADWEGGTNEVLVIPESEGAVEKRYRREVVDNVDPDPERKFKHGPWSYRMNWNVGARRGDYAFRILDREEFEGSGTPHMWILSKGVRGIVIGVDEKNHRFVDPHPVHVARASEVLKAPKVLTPLVHSPCECRFATAQVFHVPVHPNHSHLHSLVPIKKLRRCCIVLQALNMVCGYCRHGATAGKTHTLVCSCLDWAWQGFT
jgi:hypothetical protein